MLSLQEIVQKLNELSCLQLQEMSSEIDVSYHTLISLKIQRRNNPRLSTLIAISDYLNELSSSNK